MNCLRIADVGASLASEMAVAVCGEPRLCVVVCRARLCVSGWLRCCLARLSGRVPYVADHCLVLGGAQVVLLCDAGHSAQSIVEVVALWGTPQPDCLVTHVPSAPCRP